jgi:hypothetical protein
VDKEEGCSTLLNTVNVVCVLPVTLDDDVFYLFLQKQKSAQSYTYPKGTSHHTRLFRGPSTNGIKN